MSVSLHALITVLSDVLVASVRCGRVEGDDREFTFLKGTEAELLAQEKEWPGISAAAGGVMIVMRAVMEAVERKIESSITKTVFSESSTDSELDGGTAYCTNNDSKTIMEYFERELTENGVPFRELLRDSVMGLEKTITKKFKPVSPKKTILICQFSKKSIIAEIKSIIWFINAIYITLGLGGLIPDHELCPLSMVLADNVELKLDEFSGLISGRRSDSRFYVPENVFNEWVVVTNVVGQGLSYLLKWIGKNSVRGGFVEMIASGDATDKQLLSELGFNVELCAERDSDSAVSNDFELDDVISLGNLSYSEEMFGRHCSCRMRKADIAVGDTRRELSTRGNVICREIEKISESQKQLVSIEDVDEQAVDVVILRPVIIYLERFLARNWGFLLIGALFSVWMVVTNEFR